MSTPADERYKVTRATWRGIALEIRHGPMWLKIAEIDHRNGVWLPIYQTRIHRTPWRRAGLYFGMAGRLGQVTGVDAQGSRQQTVEPVLTIIKFTAGPMASRFK